MCRLPWELGSSTSWKPQGLSRLVIGLLYLLRRHSHIFDTVVTTESKFSLWLMTLVINWEIVTINLTNIIINKSNERAKQIGCSAGHEIKISDSRKNLSALFDTKDFRTSSSESVYCFQTLCNYVREQQLWQFKTYRPIYLIFLVYVSFTTSEILNIYIWN